MSGSTVNAELVIRFRDSSGPGAAAAVKSAEQTANKVATASEKASQRAAAAAERGAAKQRTSFERTAQSREALGIRSEHVIQREIQRTEAAYGRLGRAGFASADEQARAYERTRKKITQLTNEMGRLTDAQRKAADGAAAIERSQRALRIGASAVAGVAAAGYTLKAPVMQAVGFDERLANMANTAFAERDTAGRRVGMKELDAAVNRAVGKGGGGTRDQAAETLDTLIASGAMSAPEAIKALPQLMRFSAASGADPTMLANIGIRGMQTFKMRPEEMPNALNMAIAAGQAGGFELKDMARWLPQQMAAATLSGMSGRDGFARLAALNQAAAITAGTKDEAGNNVVNLLAKINSSDTANDAKKLGINLPAYLQSRRAQGVDSVTAFGELVDKTVAGRADYKAAQQRLSRAGNDGDKRTALESMATIAQGAGIGKLVQDRQALMALLGMMNNKAYMAEVLTKVKANDVATGGAGDKNYELIAGTAAFQLRQAEQAKEAGQKAALDGLTPAISKVAEGFADLAQKNPVLVGTTALATTAIAALGTAAGITAMAMGGRIPGMGIAAGAAGAAAGGSVAAEAAAATAATGAAGASRFALLGKAGAAVAPLTAMYAVTQWAGDTSNDQGRVQSLAATGGVLEKALSMLGLDKSADIEARRTRNRAELGGDGGEVNAKLTIGLAPGLVLTSQSATSNVGRVTMNTGNINSVPQ